MEEFQVSTILQLMDSNYLQDHLLLTCDKSCELA